MRTEESQAAARPLCPGETARLALFGKDLELSAFSRWGASIISEAVDNVTSYLLPEKV